jgi:hypothetical protein
MLAAREVAAKVVVAGRVRHDAVHAIALPASTITAIGRLWGERFSLFGGIGT